MKLTKGFTIFSYIPDTWEIEFKSRDEAHRYYDQVIHYFDDRLGKITVNNDSWYIGTKIPKDKFEASFDEFMTEHNISKDEYSVELTQVGKYWFPS